MTPEDIERLFAGAEVDVDRQTAPVAADEHSEGLSDRVTLLKPVLSYVETLWQSGSLRLDEAAQAIADGSRKEIWREPLGDSGILNFFLSLLATEEALRPSLILQILRLTGNACADTNANRQRVIDAGVLPKLVALLVQDAMLPIVLVVLNNLCNDHEPSQKAAYLAGLNPELITILSGPRLDQARPFFSIIFRLLEELSTQEPESNFVHPATPYVLLKLALESSDAGDLEDFLGPTPVALTYLSHQQFQDSFVQTPGAISLLLKAFTVVTDDLGPSGPEPDEQERLKKVQSVFVQAIADLSAHDVFASTYPLDSEVIQTLTTWLSPDPSGPTAAKATAASLALGNLARSDAVCTKLVQDPSLQVHKPLAVLLADQATTDAQLLHSSLSFLKNLAIPAGNKAVLGEAGLLDDGGALPRLWGLTVQPQVQFAAVSLTRLLLVQCPANVRRILQAPGGGLTDKGKTKFTSLLTAFKDSDQEPTKMEAARAALAVCRVLHSPDTELPSLLSSLSLSTPPAEGTAQPPPPPSSHLLHAFYELHGQGLVKIILHLAAQSKFPTLRSELWFVLALVARSDAGAKFLAGSVVGRYEFLSELTRTITGENAVEGKEDELNNTAATAITGQGTGQTGVTTHVHSETDEHGTTDPAITAPGVKLELEPQQVGAQAAAGLAKVDRENGIVLVHELVKQVGLQGFGSPVVADVLGKIVKDTPELLKS
ncbi:uncharacterized protein B0I36DRAFT_311587 [Microdochium trichocladiopsis]|uniref:Armadillo-type protein n=1 Tax=Microdochium trichocladiopsis TaxID=1682393 RepID=A0A9P9C069_9PEZI|nr:uncharacterized protein B0I36DRAFT_311587 [Microdochium trichocladiopsis]KAH7040829.1 hypothetical protein B0I36DRAFT_311587 [Microdochium trichocladiopsis]